jgi:type VI protein secretion system component Hcp
LYIEDIRGDATEADHRGEIELLSAKFAGSDRIGGAKLTVQELEATKRQDSASTALWKAATSGQIFPFMIVDFVLNDHTSRVTMRLVAVSSMHLSNGTESFGLNFETFSMEHF